MSVPKRKEANTNQKPVQKQQGVLTTPQQHKLKAERMHLPPTFQGSAQKAGSKAPGNQKQRKKNRNVALVNSLPKNLEDECNKFFESGCKINPQFEYDNPTLAARYRAQFQAPNSQYMEIATKIVHAFMEEYGAESNWL